VYHKEVWIWECSSRIRGANCSGFVYSSDVTDQTLLWKKQNLIAAPSLSQNELFDCWNKLVADYTKRRLTNESDRLAAISGIACRLQPSLSCVYHAGIWGSDVLGLLWYCGTMLPTFPSPPSPFFTEESLIGNFQHSDVPSWSWVASDKPVRFLTHEIPVTELRLQDPRVWQFGRAGREDYHNSGEISYHSTTRHESVQIRMSIKLKAPVWPSDVDLPKFVSFDSITEPPGTDYSRGRTGNLWIPRPNKASRDKAAKLHFVILGVRKGDSPFYDGFGIILAPSKLYTSSFVRLGIWADKKIGLRKFFPNLDVKVEYVIV
jgi:hypothetical protein